MDKFSLLITVYKTETGSNLQRALASCWDFQELKPSEIILVKDGPLTKELDKVIFEWKRKLNQKFILVNLKKNLGLGAALAKGLEHCNFDLVARMDTDDISNYHRFKLQIKEFSLDPSFDCIGSIVDEFDQKTGKIIGRRTVPERNEDIYKFSKFRNPLNHPSAVYRKSSVYHAGGPKNFTGFDDYFLWVRMMKNNCRFKNIQSPLVKMNAGRNQSSRRGGLPYFLKEISFFYSIFKIGHINFFEFLFNLGLRLPARIVPNSIRYFFYYSFLRK